MKSYAYNSINIAISCHRNCALSQNFHTRKLSETRNAFPAGKIRKEGF